jgi:hypothetical protein
VPSQVTLGLNHSFKQLFLLGFQKDILDHEVHSIEPSATVDDEPIIHSA